MSEHAPTTAEAVTHRVEKYGFGFLLGLVVCSLVGVYLHQLVLGVTVGLIVGPVLGLALERIW